MGCLCSGALYRAPETTFTPRQRAKGSSPPLCASTPFAGVSCTQLSGFQTHVLRIIWHLMTSQMEHVLYRAPRLALSTPSSLPVSLCTGKSFLTVAQPRSLESLWSLSPALHLALVSQVYSLLLTSTSCALLCLWQLLPPKPSPNHPLAVLFS